MNQDEYWMKIALQEAVIAENKGEVPVGAVIVKNNQVISKAHNCPISKNDPTAHAEIEALRKAGKKLKNYRLPKTSLYVTLEPCAMCLGAIIHARVERVIFGASDTQNGACRTSVDFLSELFSNKQLTIEGGILAQDCQKILQSFFKIRRNILQTKNHIRS